MRAWHVALGVLLAALGWRALSARRRRQAAVRMSDDWMRDLRRGGL
jgi:hypothetical protein